MASLEQLERGIVLKGVWITNERRVFLFRSNNILMVPTDIKLQSPLRPQFTETKHFKCRREEEDFLHHIEKFGHSEYRVDKNAGSTEVGDAYMSTIRYTFVPMASCIFGDDQLLLSNDALSYLSKVHQKISLGDEEERECQEYFKKFGSHCLTGPFHFGGLYLCKCSSFTEYDKLEELQKLQIEVINAQMCSCFPPCYEETSVSTLPGVAGPLWFKKNAKLQVITVGGPEKAIGFPDWKYCLFVSKGMWKMVDIGMSQVAVWDIILQHYEKHFTNAETLALSLKNCWIKSHSKSALQEQFITFVRNLKSDTPPATNLDMILTKRREIEKHIHDPRAWAMYFLPHLQDYLCSIIIAYDDVALEKIKSLFRLVVQRLDLGIIQFSSPELVAVAMEKVYDTDKYPPPLLLCDFQHFDQLLKQALEIMSLTPTFHSHLLAVGMSRIEEAILLLSQHLSKTGQEYEECFLLSIFLPCGYDPQSRKFAVILSKNDVKMLRDNFLVWAKNFFQLRDENILQKQSYLLYITVSVTHLMGAKENCIQTHIQFLRKRIKLMPEIESLITVDCDWENFKSSMNDVFVSHQYLHVGSSNTGTVQRMKQKRQASTTQNQQKLTNTQQQLLNGFLKKVELVEYYPQKLSLRDAVEIREDTISQKRDISSIYPFVMLQKIMAFDSKCRIKLDIECNTLPSHSKDGSDSDSDSDENSHCDGVHPMDGLLALLYCSDNFLRQDLFCRLATCQIAVPLLLPHPHTRDPTLLMWALRSIVKEFKCDGKTYNTRIITHPTQFVSFLRFGCHEMSKSETLNGVINKADSDNTNMAFFGYNSPGGINRKLLVNGLVEISWYLPGDGFYPKPIAFTNLRGDACDPELQKQVNFLCDVSAVHVLMLSHDALEDATRDSAITLLQKLSQAPGGLIVLQTKAKKGFKGQILECIGEDLFKLKVNVIKKDKNTTHFLDNLKEKLRNKLESNPKHVSPTSIAHKCNIAVDEDDIDCVKGKELMEELYAVIKKHRANYPNTTPKDLLPLQRKELWHRWAELDKEQYRQKRKYQHETRKVYREEKEDHKQHQGERTSEEYGAEQRGKMEKIRQQQYPLATQRNELMSSFLKTLRTERGFVLRYYLMWLKFKLDDLSRDILPPFYVKIREKRKQLSDIQQKHDAHAESICQEQLKKLDCQLINASFGIEHLFREVGQIYESAMAMKINHRNVSNLPEIAAQLTLLNTVFGVQFSVSAGRCTHGAFMQLIPVHPSLHEKAGVQYFLLIDTEGLRAPELDRLEGREHDNELATFVIGMANLTLINVAGEVSGDMDDILHTVVHAFLRMNQVQLRPSCHVIHQNVVAIGADEKMMQGRLKTKDNLDKVTKAAAKETGVETQYTHFSDVIRFDHEKDVIFLWPLEWRASNGTC